jgi:hypothetical protein
MTHFLFLVETVGFTNKFWCPNGIITKSMDNEDIFKSNKMITNVNLNRYKIMK